MGTIGRYCLVKELGQGAMGRVFLARDPELDRPVAIKLLHDASDSRARFRHEARALAALSHPGVVTIFEIGRHDGQDFIAMEYLPGRSLREALRSPEPPRREELVSICARVAAAVGAAHRAGVVHGDIKPENVVLTESGDVKVVDFGLARRHRGNDDAPPVSDDSLYGTPPYMSPELLMQGELSEASDAYALGVMLYECLAGRRPYEAASPMELVARVIDGSDPLPPLDDELGDLAAQMLARSPAIRPSLAEVAARLDGTAVSVIPPELPRRRRYLAPALALAAGSVAFGGWRALHASAADDAVPGRVEIAVAPLGLDTPTYGREPKLQAATADVLAMLLGEVDGFRTVGATDLDAEAGSDPDRTRAAGRLGATHLVRGSVTEHDGKLTADVEVVRLADGTARPISITVDKLDRAGLVDQLAQRIAASIDPRARLDFHPSRQRARRFYAAGEPRLIHADFFEAEAFLDQAVDADPTFFDGWYALSLSRGWHMAPDSQVMAAISTALALAPDPQHVELLRGVSLFYGHEYSAAREALAPLEHAQNLTALETRDVLYYLGEAHWHDGHHDLGAKYLLQVLQLDARFKPATIHLVEYAAARRDVTMTSRFLGLHEHAERDAIDLMQGNYEQLARSGSYPHSLFATLVLGREPTLAMAADLAKSPTTDDIYTQARKLAAGDSQAARASLDDLLARLSPAHAGDELPDSAYFEVMLATDSALAAGNVDETRRLIDFLTQQNAAHPVHAYHRLAMLAAPLLGDASLIAHDGLSERESRLADALTAEMRGDRAHAVKMLAALVADPTPSWDFAERAALLRNLRALGRDREARALCADSLRPPLFRPAFLPLRTQCLAGSTSTSLQAASSTCPRASSSRPCSRARS